MVKQKTFSVDQANGTLPLVSRIAKDIVEGHKDLYGAKREYQELKGQVAGDPTKEQGIEMHRLEEEAEEMQGRIQACLRELEMIGCELKDFEMGLIDFPAELDGKPILLCWKLGEKKVSFWHPTDGGYAGRQPLPA